MRRPLNLKRKGKEQTVSKAEAGSQAEEIREGEEVGVLGETDSLSCIAIWFMNWQATHAPTLQASFDKLGIVMFTWMQTNRGPITSLNNNIHTQAACIRLTTVNQLAGI